nr:MAG TPA: tail collar fiber protein [Caudoviricetes sp.]
MQANIISSTTGALTYIATENTGHYFKIGNNTASTSITTNESETAIFSHNAFEFARITNVGFAKWLGNANTATKLETSRTINGVAFDGTKDIIVDSNSNPVGTIIAVAYTGVPEGYMHCNGAAVNRTTYVNLFNKIGTTYGAGDGSTTFNLPNTVARLLEGGIGAGTYYEAGLPNITGNISAFKSSISGAFVGSNNTNRYDGWNDNDDEYAVSISFDASRSNSIYGASTTVQPPAMTVIYCIKY